MCCFAVWHSVMGQEGGLGRQGKATAKSKLIFQTILGIPFQWLEANGQLRWLLASQQFCTWISEGFCTRNGAGCYLCLKHNAQWRQWHCHRERDENMVCKFNIHLCYREVNVHICVYTHPHMSAYVFTSNYISLQYTILYSFRLGFEENIWKK